MTSIRAQGFASPTPIQCQAWPMALSGRDVVAIAQTGSGKTIAFALPAMLHINAYAVIVFCLCSSISHFLGNLYCRQETGLSLWSLPPPVSSLFRFSRSAPNLGTSHSSSSEFDANRTRTAPTPGSATPPSTAEPLRVPKSVTCSVASKLSSPPPVVSSTCSRLRKRTFAE